MKQEKRCIDLVQQKFNETEADFRAASKFFEAIEKATEGEAIALVAVDKHKGDYFHEYEDLLDYVNKTALSWDYVEAETFEDQEEGYYRLQLSWGGPSDEFRIYTTQYADEIDVIEYHFMDWFDGASVNVPVNSLSWNICQMFLDCEVA